MAGSENSNSVPVYGLADFLGSIRAGVLNYNAAKAALRRAAIEKAAKIEEARQKLESELALTQAKAKLDELAERRKALRETPMELLRLQTPKQSNVVYSYFGLPERGGAGAGGVKLTDWNRVYSILGERLASSYPSASTTVPGKKGSETYRYGYRAVLDPVQQEIVSYGEALLREVLGGKRSAESARLALVQRTGGAPVEKTGKGEIRNPLYGIYAAFSPALDAAEQIARSSGARPPAVLPEERAQAFSVYPYRIRYLAEAIRGGKKIVRKGDAYGVKGDGLGTIFSQEEYNTAKAAAKRGVGLSVPLDGVPSVPEQSGAGSVQEAQPLYTIGPDGQIILLSE